MRTTTHGRTLPWFVVAVIGDLIRDTDGFVVMKTIVIAKRATEAEAARERDRRNAVDDDRWYFVMHADEYKPVR